MIYEKEPLETKFISPPRDMNVQCAYFSAGIIKGALNAADFVSTHFNISILINCGMDQLES